MNGIYIRDFSCISALGISGAEAAERYRAPEALFSLRQQQPVFTLSAGTEQALQEFIKEQSWLQRHSRTVQLAVFAASFIKTGPERKTLVNIGSSRGSTDLWELHYRHALSGQRLSPAASPATTPGNIASSVARYLAAGAVVLDHSITCGSGLQAIANAAAWLRAGMCEQALAGGTEAPLSDFTLAQFRSLGIVSPVQNTRVSMPLGRDKKQNSLCLGEGAGMVLLSSEPSEYRIAGLGFGTEQAASLSGITPEGQALQQSMRAALQQSGIGEPDVLIAHAPGTLKGDEAETRAIQALFGTRLPVFSTKHLSGHTLGASGMLSMQLALLLLQGLKPAPLPYETVFRTGTDLPVHSVLINATGFGGNAISLLLCRDTLTS